jgi:glycosyltransferase involved in cell wall biosynthesis
MATEGGRRAANGCAANRAPMFSVVTCVANGAATIENTIKSVLGQTHRDFEYLVFDAKSSDGTAEILARYDDRIDYWCSEPDSGIYDAWNKAVRRARGTWIGFVGCDDQYYADALQKYAQLISRNDNERLQYVSSRVDFMLDGTLLQTIGRAWNWPEFSRYMTVAHVGSLHHRSLFAEYGEFDSRYRICGDYEMLLRPKNRLRTAYLPESTAMANYGGVSNLLAGPALREARRAKSTSGGRPVWRCEVEYLSARVKALVRGKVRWRPHVRS